MSGDFPTRNKLCISFLKVFAVPSVRPRAEEVSVLRRPPGSGALGVETEEAGCPWTSLVSGRCQVWEFSQDEKKAALVDGVYVCVSYDSWKHECSG